ncbi:hypothetical protein DL764_006302 [Monosporascus ibericus]|uniref:Nucleotide exchange factor SIL1 n=1 Tax=Monosporascus ibericus TaxID=155417 RepID=A0A4Q4T7J4_9PEZI|nr:hypothetical protein DL764_006302 [Monosporascus ibericus]
MRSSYIRSLLRSLFSITLISAVISPFASAASSAPLESPSAEGELICHTDNPAECYPKVFSPTEEFQVIHDDQDLPPGLHVQLDIQTGQKRARLNVPTEENPALQGLPVDRSVVVIDSESPPDTPRIPPGAPEYDPVGKVKEPQEKNEGFFRALETVKSHTGNGEYVQSVQLSHALDELEELSHDIYYGLQIAEDTTALQGLFCILTNHDKEEALAQPLAARSDFLASSIISSAVRNNRPALHAVEASWDNIMQSHCTHRSYSLKHALYEQLAPSAGPSNAEEALEADFIRLNLAVLDGLIKSPKIRDEFLAHGGMKSLLRILLTPGDVWGPRRARAARIVSDTFLDEDVGAELGIWPKAEVLENSQCAKGQPDSLDDGCWEYHLEMVNDPSDAEWSRSLLSLLRSRRPGASQSRSPPPREEL